MASKRKWTRIGREVWSAMDWNRPAREIQVELGCSLAAVYAAAIRQGKRIERIPSGPQSLIRWEKVDLSKRNIQIARENVVTRERVRVMRKRFAPDK